MRLGSARADRPCRRGLSAVKHRREIRSVARGVVRSQPPRLENRATGAVGGLRHETLRLRFPCRHRPARSRRRSDRRVQRHPRRPCGGRRRCGRRRRDQPRRGDPPRRHRRQRHRLHARHRRCRAGPDRLLPPEDDPQGRARGVRPQRRNRLLVEPRHRLPDTDGGVVVHDVRDDVAYAASLSTLRGQRRGVRRHADREHDRHAGPDRARGARHVGARHSPGDVRRGALPPPSPLRERAPPRRRPDQRRNRKRSTRSRTPTGGPSTRRTTIRSCPRSWRRRGSRRERRGGARRGGRRRRRRGRSTRRDRPTPEKRCAPPSRSATGSSVPRWPRRNRVRRGPRRLGRARAGRSGEPQPDRLRRAPLDPRGEVGLQPPRPRARAIRRASTTRTSSRAPIPGTTRSPPSSRRTTRSSPRRRRRSPRRSSRAAERDRPSSQQSPPSRTFPTPRRPPRSSARRGRRARGGRRALGSGTRRQRSATAACSSLDGRGRCAAGSGFFVRVSPVVHRGRYEHQDDPRERALLWRHSSREHHPGNGRGDRHPSPSARSSTADPRLERELPHARVQSGVLPAGRDSGELALVPGAELHGPGRRRGHRSTYGTVDRQSGLPPAFF